MQRTEEDSYQRLLHRLVQSVRTGSASRALPRQGEPGRVPVVEFVDRMIAEALRLRASDIHIEPFEGAVRIRTVLMEVYWKRMHRSPGRCMRFCLRD